MAQDQASRTDQLVQEVLRGAKYRAVSVDLVRRIGQQELAAHRTMKDAVKATRNRLHKVYGAFLAAPPRYSRWLEELRVARGVPGEERLHGQEAGIVQGAGTCRGAAPAPWQPALLEACRRIMARHASTAERLPLLPEFYRTVLADLPPIRSVLDLGCGLNPLAIPWMGLAADVTYTCCDIDAALIALLNHFFALAGVNGRAEVRDLVSSPPREAADLALALKLVPTLDQIERDAGATLLRALHASSLLVSFPARSLGGHEKGMERHYEARFLALAGAEGWTVRRFSFATELAFLVRRL